MSANFELVEELNLMISKHPAVSNRDLWISQACWKYIEMRGNLLAALAKHDCISTYFYCHPFSLVGAFSTLSMPSFSTVTKKKIFDEPPVVKVNSLSVCGTTNTIF